MNLHATNVFSDFNVYTIPTRIEQDCMFSSSDFRISYVMDNSLDYFLQSNIYFPMRISSWLTSVLCCSDCLPVSCFCLVSVVSVLLALDCHRLTRPVLRL